MDLAAIGYHGSEGIQVRRIATLNPSSPNRHACRSPDDASKCSLKCNTDERSNVCDNERNAGAPERGSADDCA